MPLYSNAERLIRGCFSVIKRGKNPRRVAIGWLTDKQLSEINKHRAARAWAPVRAEILFHGRHVYQSRIAQDGYTEDDVIAQIVSSMGAESEVKITPKMAVLRNPNRRNNGYGTLVNDEAVLECTSQHPNPILYSTIPKGDKLPLKKTEEPPVLAALVENMADPPG